MKYSIITPVFNRADCISRCMDSVIRNLKHEVELEHIIVDDGSKDHTPQIIQEYANHFPHIKFISFPKNRGTNAARNEAIATSTGDFCIILDSDDYFVDDALATIDSIAGQGRYHHYCFTPDDMENVYSKNKILANKSSCVIKYEDFILNRVAGDFIHVIDSSILRKYPFHEDLRINEGVFFKRFYKEEKEILFTNKIVTIRERNRTDSVTRSVFRNDKEAVGRTVKANTLLLEWFREDMEKHEEGRVLISQILMRNLDNVLILGNYKHAKEIMLEIEKLNQRSIPQYLKLVYHLRLGWLYFLIGSVYIYLKYNVLKAEID